MRAPPTFGWRCWIVGEGGVLVSPWDSGLGPTYWPTPTLIAECGTCNARPPASECRCGVRFVPSARNLADLILGWDGLDDDRVIAAGTVRASGLVLPSPGQPGVWRASAATVVGSLHLCAPIWSGRLMANRYKVHVLVAEALTPRNFLRRIAADDLRLAT